VSAEYAAVGEEWLYPTPESVSDVDAAALALVGITAHLGLFDRARLVEGESVYVAGGAAGSARWSSDGQGRRGPGRTTAGSADGLAFCRSLGADLAIDYKNDDVPAQLRAFAPEGIDVWFETQREPDLEVSIPLLRRWGRMILMAGRTATPKLPLGSFYTRNCSIFGYAMFNFRPMPSAAAPTTSTAGRSRASCGPTSAGFSRWNRPPRRIGSSKTTRSMGPAH
jgi:NADPH2:quinone reductase